MNVGLSAAEAPKGKESNANAQKRGNMIKITTTNKFTISFL